ncbi:MAG: hypothetical protein HY657_15535 [Acidobacteria bacterium]|nr:hypothetical protein [Acidobacteriota bacterium]
MRSRALLTLLLVVAAGPREVAAQLDPLLFLKRPGSGAAATRPNIILAVDTANRMQRDANDVYLDHNVYSATGATWETALGVTALNTATQYRRKYMSLAHLDPNANAGDKFEADWIDIVGDLEGTAYSTFDERTRLAVARRGLHEAVSRNRAIARFGLLKTRQSNPRFTAASNEGPVKITNSSNTAEGAAQKLDGDQSTGKWKITRPTVDAINGSISLSGNLSCSSSGTACLVAADSSGTDNDTTLTTLNFSTTRSSGDLTTFLGSLTPAGRDGKNTVDAPIDLMLDDIKNEVARLAAADTQCRNSVAVLVVGGGRGTTSSGDLAAKALDFLNIGSNHRVPIYVIAVSPAASDDMSALQAVAANSGGKYTLITAAMIEAADAGQPVPELVYAVNTAVQHAFTKQSDCDTDPDLANAPELPFGPYTEHQVTSPIVGTVYLKDAKDVHGDPLDDSSTSFNETYITNASGEIPQRSNVLITAGFSLPGFDGKMRAFRVYKPEEDASKPIGYKFTADGTRLWVACAPGTATPGFLTTPCSSLSTSQRNIYTALPDGTVVALTTGNAPSLKDYLLPSSRHPNADVTDAEALIAFIRSQPLGAMVGSTPAIMDAPSLDPPPDSDYPAFKTAHANRRSLVWVGANDGMLHAIDGRLGIEVWAFIPFNLLPKLYTLRSGQPVGDFRYFVDGSPKVADVKVDRGSGPEWRTFLVMGEGAGGTFYQTFDVTLPNMDLTVSRTSDTASEVLDYFDTASSVPLVWAFPRYSSFDVTLGCDAVTSGKLCTGSSAHLVFGELSSTASSVEKTVGETWSDPAVGQIESDDGPYAVLTGSGFYKYSLQGTYRNSTPAGTTFYLIDAETGEVLASRDVGRDSNAESGTAADNCAAANDCTKLKNALQADPVATGPSDSRFITKAYLGDLDGRIWRFDISLDVALAPQLAVPVKLYDAGAAHPLFSSMATVNVGTTQQYLFQGTGSEFLPSNNVSQQYKLLVVLDNGTSGTKKAEILLEKTDSSGNDEKVTAFPAVAGDIVFFATTTYKANPCTLPDANLYAFTFIGGPAYDTNNDGTIKTTGSSADSTKVRTTTGARATAPFIVDQHLVFGTGGNIEMFGADEDFNNGVGQVGVRILSWREVR